MIKLVNLTLIVLLLFTACKKGSEGAITDYQVITVAGGNGSGNLPNQLTIPVSIYLDTQGNLYIADGRNDRVQKWAPGASQGVTVAGGNGQGSSLNQLYNPNDIYVDSNGDIYVSDGDNHRVQKWF